MCVLPADCSADPVGLYDTGSVTRNQTILVDNGTIRAIGPAVVVPAGAKTVDLSNEYVMPGLMDAHTHLSLTELIGDAPFESFYIKESSTYRAMRAVHNGEVVLHQGFTTVRDLGNGADYAMMDVQRGIANGWFVGPTVLTTGKIITPFGGQSHSIPSEQGSFWKYEYLDADSPAEIRKAVRQNIYYVIKLVLDNSAYHYSVEEIRAAVDEAHHANVPVAVHVYGGEALDNAIEAGVDSIEHGFFLTDAQLKKMKEKGIALVGTDFPRAHLDIVGTSGGIFPEPKVLAPAIIDRLSRAYTLGVKIAFGSDTVIAMDQRRRGCAAGREDARPRRRGVQGRPDREAVRSAGGSREPAPRQLRHEGRRRRSPRRRALTVRSAITPAATARSPTMSQQPIEYADASAEVRAIYDDIMSTRKTDWINNFWKVLAHHPPTLRRMWANVKEVMGPGALDPLTKELIYVAVSVTNNCQYCIASHTKGMTDEQHAELMAIIGLANDTNRLVNGYRAEIDERFK